jgi:two-component system sensor histidine kinase DesK
MTSAPDRVEARNGPRRWGVLFAAVWLFYLFSPLHAGWERRDQPSGWIGMAAVLAFAAVYLAMFLSMRLRRPGTPFRTPIPLRYRLLVLVVEVGLAVTVCVSVGQAGTATAVYIAVSGVVTLRTPWAWALALVTGCVAYGAGFVVDGWEREDAILFAVLAATLAVWGISRAIEGNIEMLAVREENARLALEEQRTGFARDLHDILGHSLTVITVKAELAQRLLGVDDDRARREVADLERLSRDALADVRRAVEGYRDLTLPGELARARTALQAAEIRAELPNSTDEVPSRNRELFAWAVREGVTNVLRHSGATCCRIRIAADEVEVSDNGVGPAPGPTAGGNGLAGLQERAAGLGGRVVTTALSPGFSLRVVAP